MTDPPGCPSRPCSTAIPVSDGRIPAMAEGGLVLWRCRVQLPRSVMLPGRDAFDLLALRLAAAPRWMSVVATLGRSVIGPDWGYAPRPKRGRHRQPLFGVDTDGRSPPS